MTDNIQQLFLPLFLLTVNHGKFPKQEDSYAFEEDSSSESLSPDQHHSDESQGSACPSNAVGSTASSSSSPVLNSSRKVLFLICNLLIFVFSGFVDVLLPLLHSCGYRVNCLFPLGLPQSTGLSWTRLLTSLLTFHTVSFWRLLLPAITDGKLTSEHSYLRLVKRETPKCSFRIVHPSSS